MYNIFDLTNFLLIYFCYNSTSTAKLISRIFFVASSQSLPLTSVLSNPIIDRKKSSSKSEGSNNSRKVSFIDSITGISAQPNPQLANQLAQQLEIVKEAGEMGEFLQQQQQPSTTTTTSNFKL